MFDGTPEVQLAAVLQLVLVDPIHDVCECKLMENRNNIQLKNCFFTLFKIIFQLKFHPLSGLLRFGR